MSPVRASSPAPAGTGGDAVLTVYVLRRSAPEPEVIQLAGHPRPGIAHLAPTPDGETVYVAYRWEGEDDADGSNLAVLDLATGETVGDVPIQVRVPASRVDVQDAAVRPDGGVAVLVRTSFNSGSRQAAVYAVDHAPDLQPAAEAVEVAPDEAVPLAPYLAVTPDGGTLVPVWPGEGDGDERRRLVTIRNGAVKSVVPLAAGAPSALDPGGRSLFQ